MVRGDFFFFNPDLGRAGYRWGYVGPQANLGSRRDEHSPGAWCILSDYIRYEASRGFLSW